MQKMRICLLVMIVLTTLCLAGCGGENDDENENIAPIHLEMDTSNLQHRVGLSGFIFGTFLLINAYIIIIASSVVLLVKEKTFQKISDTVRMGSQMMGSSEGQDGALLKVLGMLSSADTRYQIGSAGLIIGLVMAYFGAWIAT